MDNEERLREVETETAVTKTMLLSHIKGCEWKGWVNLLIGTTILGTILAQLFLA